MAGACVKRYFCLLSSPSPTEWNIHQTFQLVLPAHLAMLVHGLAARVQITELSICVRGKSASSDTVRVNLKVQPRPPRIEVTPAKTTRTPYPDPYAQCNSCLHKSNLDSLSLIDPLIMDPTPLPAPNNPIRTPTSFL